MKTTKVHFKIGNKSFYTLDNEVTVNDLLTQNSKLKKTSKKVGKKCMNFGILAGYTCPFAGECLKFCFGKKGHYSMQEKKFMLRYQITLLPNFVEIMQNEINRKKPLFIRIHDSGDFYNIAYLKKWIKLAKNNKHIKFYAYTKSLPFFEKISLPENFDFIKSFGSKKDHLINTKIDRHAKIFDNWVELEKNGYTNVMENDLLATKWYTKSKKIGLIFH